MKIKRKQLRNRRTEDIDRQRIEIPELMCDDIYLARLLTDADDKRNNKYDIPLPATGTSTAGGLTRIKD